MIALTSKAVFHLASQSSTGEVSTNRVSGFVAVHPCCNAAELCEVKKLIGVIALTSKAVFHLASQCDCTDKQGCFSSCFTEQHW